MPRLLSLPLSELFTEPSGAASAESFPSPWHGAPLPIALKARQLAEDAALFSDAPGRRNVLVCRADNDDPAQQSILLIASQSPADFVLPDPNETLPMADRIAGKTSCGAFEEAARSVEILTMAGTRTSLLAFAESDRARRPPKIARGGAAGLNLTFEHWNRALLDAVESPLAANLLAAAQARAAGRKLTALASMEWWRGSAPIYDVKWDGMALSPKQPPSPWWNSFWKASPLQAIRESTHPSRSPFGRASCSNTATLSRYSNLPGCSPFRAPADFRMP